MQHNLNVILLIGAKFSDTDGKWVSFIKSLLTYYQEIKRMCHSRAMGLHAPRELKVKWAWLNAYYSESCDGTWMDSKQFEEQLPTLIQRTDVKKKQGSVSEKIHDLADKLSLSGSGNYTLELFWLTNWIHKLDQSAGLYGSLLRLRSCHNAKITILTKDAPNQDVQQWLTCMPAKGCTLKDWYHKHHQAPTLVLWRGNLEAVTNDGITHYEHLQLVQQLKQSNSCEAPCLTIESQEVYFGSTLTLVEDCDIRTVPAYLFSNRTCILEACYDTTGTSLLLSALQPTTVFRLYHCDTGQETYTTEKWKAMVLNENLRKPTTSNLDSYIELVSVLDTSLDASKVRLVTLRDPNSLGMLPSLLLQLDTPQSESDTDSYKESNHFDAKEWLRSLPNLMEANDPEANSKLNIIDSLPPLPKPVSYLELDPADWPEKEWLYSNEKVEAIPLTSTMGKCLEVRDILKPFDTAGKLKETFKKNLSQIGDVSKLRLKSVKAGSQEKLTASSYDICYNTSEEIERREISNVEKQRLLVPRDTDTVCNVWSIGIEIPLPTQKKAAKPVLKAKRQLAKTPVKKVLSSVVLATRHSPRLQAKYRQESIKSTPIKGAKEIFPTVATRLTTPVKKVPMSSGSVNLHSPPAMLREAARSPKLKNPAVVLKIPTFQSPQELRTPVKKTLASLLSPVRHSPRLKARTEQFGKPSTSSTIEVLNAAVVQALDLRGITNTSESYEYCVQKLTGICNQFIEDVEEHDLFQELLEIAKTHALGVIKLASKRKT